MSGALQQAQLGGRATLYCSFCGKSQHEVRKLIAGPTVFICDECVELCRAIVDEDLAGMPPRGTEGQRRWAWSQGQALAIHWNQPVTRIGVFADAALQWVIAPQADRNPKGGDGEAAPSRSDESGGPAKQDAPEVAPTTEQSK